MKISEATLEFVSRHANDDVRKLALSAKRTEDLDLTFALDQIAGRQMARTKLPSWFGMADKALSEGADETHFLVFPPHISMEQCSSEQTAKYKQQVLATVLATVSEGAIVPGHSCPGLSANSAHFIDVTGGFGVDFIALSKHFGKAIYVERNAELCKIAEQNFHTLNLTNTQIVNAEAEDFLSPTPTLPSREGALKYDSSDSKTIQETLPLLGGVGGGLLFFADPARRSESGSRTYAISDCTPDILQLIPVLKKHVTPPIAAANSSLFTLHSSLLFLKLSPMLDWHKAVEDIQAQGVNVSEVHIVSVKNECKELLLLVELQSAPQPAFRLFCVNDESILEITATVPTPIAAANSSLFTLHSSLLLLPNASIMKAGCWDFLISRFGVTQADPNSHIFFSDHEIADFPGKQYRIQTVCTMNKKELRNALQGITHANIAVRNFPLSADALRKRLKLKDGGDTYIFGTTIQGEHRLIVATPPNLPTREE